MCEHPQTHAKFRPPAEPCRSDARKSSKRASDRARTRGRRRVVSLRIRVALMICCHAHGPTAHLAAAREDGPRKRRCRWVRVPRRLGPGGSPMPMDRRQQASKRGNEQLVPVAIKLRARAMLYALSFPSSFLTGRLPCSFRDPAAHLPAAATCGYGAAPYASDRDAAIACRACTCERNWDGLAT
jgi:hypothetical protein